VSRSTHLAAAFLLALVVHAVGGLCMENLFRFQNLSIEAEMRPGDVTVDLALPVSAPSQSPAADSPVYRLERRTAEIADPAPARVLSTWNLPAPDREPQPLRIAAAPAREADRSREPRPAVTELTGGRAVLRDGGPVMGGVAERAGHGESGSSAGPAASVEEEAETGWTLTGDIRPRYPLGSRLRGEEGRLRVRLRVNRQGGVGEAELIQSSGFPALDRVALESARKARFVTRSGSPAAGDVVLSFRFQLVD
jgi:protein TonB